MATEGGGGQSAHVVGMDDVDQAAPGPASRMEAAIRTKAVDV